MPRITNNLTWKIGGVAGDGIMATGEIFSKICTRGGLWIFDYPEYPSLIRGGHNDFEITISDKEIHAQKRPISILVALNKETVDLHLNELAEESVLIYDSGEFDIKDKKIPPSVITLGVPFIELAEKGGGIKIMKNNVALGASMAVLNYDFSLLAKVIEENFQTKGQKIIDANLKAAQSGYDYVKENLKKESPYELKKIEGEERIVLTANEALSLGAIAGGCKLYCSYPMTPSTSILHFLASQAEKYQMVVKQPEDELSVINMALGGATCGARTMVASSGGGFSLMVEALGNAGVAEIPVVIVESQRVGPATGLPTWTEQGDLRFALHAAQGEFPRVVLAPGDSDETFYETIRALNLAEKYQLPVIILLDKYISEGRKTCQKFDQNKIKIERGELLSESELDNIKDYKRYRLTPSGISPRALPGMIGGFQLVNSYEHDERGFATEDAKMRTEQVDKRARKLETMKTDIPEPVLYGPEDADITIFAWGSTKGPILEGMKLLEAEGIKVNFLHFIYIHPFPKSQVEKVFKKTKKTICLENNTSGQLRGLIRENVLKNTDHSLLKYDGRPFYPDEIAKKIKEIT